MDGEDCIMGWLKKAVKAITKPIEKAVSSVVETVKDVGSFIDDKVIQPIVKDPVEAIGIAVATYYGGALGAGAAKTAFELDNGKELDEALKSGAKTAATVYVGQQVVQGATGQGTTGPVADVGAAPGVEVFPVAPPAPVTITPIEAGGLIGGTAGGLLGGGAELASVAETMAPPPGPSTTYEFGYQPVTEVSPAPVIEATPVSTNPTRFPGVEVQPTYTPSPGSFQEALPSLGIETQATTAPYTALPGTFPAAVAATTGGLLSTPAAPSTISIQQALRGAQLANQLLSPQQVPTPNLLARAQEALAQQGAVDYSSLLGLLSQQAGGTGLLGTRFQPQPINLASLLG